MSNATASQQLSLEPYDSYRLASLCGRLDEHISQIARRLDVEILNRGNLFHLSGDAIAVKTARHVLSDLYAQTEDGTELTPEAVHLQLRGSAAEPPEPAPARENQPVDTRRGQIRPRGANQREYMERIHTHDLNFGVGPAGTGKTWLAVACAVQALESQEVERILLVRPAIEAGENLGFLPGDLVEKVDPYLRPLYDALYEMLGFNKVNRLLQREVIEVAPLAYMRGRTLNNSFIILDEGQNTTVEQMKMFLTRIGFGSRTLVTGDMTQVDLAHHQRSGLAHALEVLGEETGIGITHFDSGDVVRHPLVQRIVEAYERHEQDSSRRS